MLCEACGDYEANVHLTHVADGVARRIDLCEQCAAKSGINIDAPSVMDAIMIPGGDEGARCTFCHTTITDIRKTQRVGCAVCYETFAKELKPLIEGMQKSEAHRGKVPSDFAGEQEAMQELATLRDELAEAVASENYEEAARLRDTMKSREVGQQEARK